MRPRLQRRLRLCTIDFLKARSAKTSATNAHHIVTTLVSLRTSSSFVTNGRLSLSAVAAMIRSGISGTISRGMEMSLSATSMSSAAILSGSTLSRKICNHLIMHFAKLPFIDQITQFHHNY